MSYQDQLGNPARQTDEYGNPARQTDEYGNPVHHAGGTGTYGTKNTSGVPVTGSGYGEGQQQMHGQGPNTTTNPKGMTEKIEKIKERIPGVGQKEHQGPTCGTTNTTPTSHTVGQECGTGQYQEKKGMTEKVKERIPGVGQHQGPTTATATPTSQTEGQHYGTGLGQGQNQDKKGMMEKIKEKLPGQH